MSARTAVLLALVPAAVVTAGCGGSKHALTASATTAPTPTTVAKQTTAGTTTTHLRTTTTAGPGSLRAEATSAATGDIPDNQVFLRFTAAGWSIKYPEGWAQTRSRGTVTFRDKNNIVRITVGKGSLPGLAQAKAELRTAALESGPQSTTISGARGLKLLYTTSSPPNAVTGKRVRLVVDRYYLARAGRRAVVDLGTPEGVDNVDAYRLMIESFRWR